MGGVRRRRARRIYRRDAGRGLLLHPPAKERVLAAQTLFKQRAPLYRHEVRALPSLGWMGLERSNRTRRERGPIPFQNQHGLPDSFLQRTSGVQSADPTRSMGGQGDDQPAGENQSGKSFLAQSIPRTRVGRRLGSSDDRGRDAPHRAEQAPQSSRRRQVYKRGGRIR